MTKIEDHCCDCAVPGYPCLGSACPRTHVPVPYCDECGYKITGDVFLDDGEELCEDCYEERLKKVS